ncbi:MAG: aspartate carbamoyltransferase regulatory subunit [Clostridia bacterium]|nr:aspartate carbamoyltransferase regulatory subunit [Clostridia bacterium]
MNIDSIHNGIVLDHIQAGKAMEIYRFLGLDSLDCSVAIIKNAPSKKQGRKDIIKVDSQMDLDLNILGFIDPAITVNIIRDGKLVEKKHLTLPEQIRDVLKCKNPRCITSVEQELPHVFKLTDRARAVYRCIYCETKAGG